jgi:hypothetical protein
MHRCRPHPCVEKANLSNKCARAWGGGQAAAAPSVMRQRSHCAMRRYGARFSAGTYTRGCHWIPRLCSLEASRRVTNGIPLESPLFLPVHTVICVQPLKAACTDDGSSSPDGSPSTSFQLVRCAFFTMDSAVLGLGSLGCDCWTVRVFRREFCSRGVPLVPTPLFLRLKLLHACDQCHSSRKFHSLTGWHCKFRPNTEGKNVLELASVAVYGARFSAGFCTLDSAVLGIASSGCDCCTACGFHASLHTRGCHWFPRLFA